MSHTVTLLNPPQVDELPSDTLTWLRPHAHRSLQFPSAHLDPNTSPLVAVNSCALNKDETVKITRHKEGKKCEMRVKVSKRGSKYGVDQRLSAKSALMCSCRGSQTDI